MSITHRQLQAFVQVAQSNTFADAANKLHLSQPALSVSIKKLEHTLGGTLFARSTRKVTLTPEGREFLPIANRLLDDWQGAVADIQSLFSMQRGVLHVAAMPSFASSLLPQLLQRYTAEHPNINIRVVDVVMEEVVNAVLSGRAELGFVFEHEQMFGLDFHPLLEEPFIVILPSAMAVDDKAAMSFEALSELPLVAMNRGSTLRRWLEQTCQARNIVLNIVAEAGQLATIGQLVRSGLGAAVIPGICRELVGDEGVIERQLVDADLTRRIGVIRAQPANLSQPASAFWQQLTG